MRRIITIGAAALVAIGAASAAAIAATGGGSAGSAGAEAAKKPIKYDDDELFIEINATDGDAGLQLDLDGEDWKRTKLLDPKGKTIMDVKAKGRFKDYGLTGLTFETAEPSFDEIPFKQFKKRFPEGTYKFKGRTIEGRKLKGSDKVSHLVPDMPNITSPTKDATVDPKAFTVRWDPVTTPSGIEIERYLVIVTHEEPTVREIEMELPASATSVVVPPGFLQPGDDAKVEVLAKDKNGNQTITEIPFKVA